MNDQVTISSPLLKISTALAAVGVTSWSEFASMCAALYTICLISEWLWKTFIKPALIRRGVVGGQGDGE